MKPNTTFKQALASAGVLVSLAALPVTARAEAGLTLGQAIQEATERSPQLKQLEAGVDATSWRRLGALSGYLPHLSADMDHFFTAKYSRLALLFNGAAVDFPSAYPQTTINLNASIDVFDGLGTYHAWRAASYEHDESELRLSRARFGLEEEVRSRFNEALAAQLLKSVADQNIRSLDDHLSIARATVRSGLGTSFDVLRIEAQLEEAKAEQLLAEDNVSLSRQRLAQAMGFEKDDPRPLEGGLPIPNENDVPKDLTLDVSAREDIRAEQMHEEAQDERRAASNGFWFPKVSLFAQEQFYKFGTFDPVVISNDSFQNAYALGLKLTWNLFDGGASLAKSREAAAQARASEGATAAKLTDAPVEFEMAKRRFFYNSRLYQARLRTIDKSQESVRLAKLGLKAGVRTHTEVLDAELDLFRARAGAVRAQADAVEALAQLELAIGRRLAAASK